MIAAAVASDKEKYNEAFLGKPNEEYCTWILNPEKWGGYLICLKMFLWLIMITKFHVLIRVSCHFRLFFCVRCD